MEVIVIDDTHQSFRGKIYCKNKKGYYVNNKHTLHVDVWKWHYPLKKNRDIHHKDLNKDNNQIENLQMLTRAEHRALHAALSNPPKEIICAVCGKKFLSKKARKRCPECVAEIKRQAELKKNQPPKPPKKPRTRECVVCGKTFELRPRESTGRKTCSAECHDKLVRKLPDKICPVCGKIFRSESRRSKQKYCSRACAAQAKEKVVSHCELCGKEIIHTPAKKPRFCSQDCVRKYMAKVNRKDLKDTEEIRSCACCGKSFRVKKKLKKNYCSAECREKLKLKPCPVCGKLFVPHGRQTCSRLCAGRLRRRKLAALADKSAPSPEKQKILLHAANLINGKKIF